MRLLSLQRALRRASAIALVAACGSKAGSDPGTAAPSNDGLPDKFKEACSGESLPIIGGLTANGAPFDWVAVQREEAKLPYPTPGDPDAGPADSFKTIEEQRGTPCSGATDHAACTKKLDALTAVEQCTSTTRAFCKATYLVYTRGDEVGMAVTKEERIALLLPIDTKEEAFYSVLWSQGLQPSCAAGAKVRSKYFADPNGGFELVFQKLTCQFQESSPSATVEALIVKVREDGSSSIIETRPVEGRMPCPPPPDAE